VTHRAERLRCQIVRDWDGGSLQREFNAIMLESASLRARVAGRGQLPPRHVSTAVAAAESALMRDAERLRERLNRLESRIGGLTSTGMDNPNWQQAAGYLVALARIVQ
jgi:hypothetical protein